MASYDFDSDCPPLFKGTNYVLWRETMQACIKHKDLELWEIMINGPITIDKFEDEYTEDDYKKISQNFKVINILYCALTIDIDDCISLRESAKEIWKTLNCIYGTDQNVLLSEFFAQDEIIIQENVKRVEDCQHREEQKYKNDDLFQDILHDSVEYTRTMEIFENGEKDKNSYCSSLLKNGEYEVRSVVEFSHINLSPTFHIFDDLITITNFRHLKFFDCGIKPKKWAEIERKKKFDRRASFFQKLTENFHYFEKLLTIHFDINDLLSIVFKPPENSTRVKKKKEREIGMW